MEGGGNTDKEIYLMRVSIITFSSSEAMLCHRYSILANISSPNLHICVLESGAITLRNIFIADTMCSKSITDLS